MFPTKENMSLPVPKEQKRKEKTILQKCLSLEAGIKPGSANASFDPNEL